MNRYLLLILGIIALTSLTLSIISLTKCKDNFGGEILNAEDCKNSGLSEEAYNSCIKNMEILSNNINAQYQGLPANRGLTNPGGADAGAFGNPDIISTEGPEGLEGPEDF